MQYSHKDKMIYHYSHGGNVYDENGFANNIILDFSVNINPKGIPNEVIDDMENWIEQIGMYPDSQCRRLSCAIAEFEAVPMSNVFCSNGASDIIFRLIYAVKPKKILTAAPSFADYERASKAVGAEIFYYCLKKEKDFTIDSDIVNQILTVSPDIVFICNPNNPTGTLTDRRMMESIAETCRSVGSILLVDECFIDFVVESSKHSLKTILSYNSNVVILKAFTKIFAIPGLRLGYALCSNVDLTNRMRFCGPDWAVSGVAQSAGLAVLKNASAYIGLSARYVEKERDSLISELNKMDITVYPSLANFIYIYCPWGADLHVKLLKKGILIRDCSNFYNNEVNHYRIAVLEKEKNQRLVRTLAEVYEDYH